jgi:hypothetical protein
MGGGGGQMMVACASTLVEWMLERFPLPHQADAASSSQATPRGHVAEVQPVATLDKIFRSRWVYRHNLPHSVAFRHHSMLLSDFL